MLALISFLLVIIGSINWFCIGILQFDFVAGIFGSQSNIFSRLIYTLVGIASIIMIVNFAKNKGKFVVSFKKADKEFEEYKEEKKATPTRRKKALSTEAGEDFSIEKDINNSDNEESEPETEKEDTNNCGCDGNENCDCGSDCDCNKPTDNTFSANNIKGNQKK